MRIGLIGLGRIGAFHADTLAALDRVDELVVTDPIGAAVDAVTARIGKATAVSSPEAVLDAGVDGVVIAANTGAHAELLLASAGPASRPSARSRSRGPPTRRSSCATAGRLRRRGADRLPAPLRPGIRRRARCRAAGELGRVHTVRSTTLDPAPPPAAYLAGSGGIFRDCSVHDFDAVRWVTGHEAVEVYAVGAVDPDAAAGYFADHGDYSTASVLITLDDGSIGVVSNTRTNARGYDVRLEVHGVKDAVAAGLDEGLPLRPTQPGITWPAGPPHTFFMDRLTEAFRRELATFCAVAAGRSRRRAPSRTPWAPPGSPRRPRCRREGRPVRIDEVAR